MAFPEQIVGLVGKKGSGKDTVAAFMGCKTIAFADPLRTVVQTLFDLSPELMVGADKEKPGPMGVSYRRAMQIVGTEIVRKQIKDLLPELKVEDGQFWVEHVRRTLQKMHAEGERKVVITDVRFPNEAKAIVDMGGRLIHVVSSKERLDQFYEENGWVPEDMHTSETGVDDIVAQFTCETLNNCGTLGELDARVQEMFER